MLQHIRDHHARELRSLVYRNFQTCLESKRTEKPEQCWKGAEELSQPGRAGAARCRPAPGTDQGQGLCLDAAPTGGHGAPQVPQGSVSHLSNFSAFSCTSAELALPHS